jgi:hypothetical protein
MGGHIAGHDGIGADRDEIANFDFTEYFCPCADKHMLANRRITIFFSFRERTAKRDTVKNNNIRANNGSSTDNDAVPMYDPASACYFSLIVNINAVDDESVAKKSSVKWGRAASRENAIIGR